MGKFIKTILCGGMLFSLMGSWAYAFWFGGPGSYVDVPLPQEAIRGRPRLNTDTVFVLTADSFVDDQGNPTKVQGANFSHGIGVITKQIETFQRILQTNPQLSSTILIVTDGKRPLAIYDANGEVDDPSKIPPDSKRIFIILADIPGEKEIEVVDKKTGKKTGEKKISFDAASAYKTISDALEVLKPANAPVIVNLSLSANPEEEESVRNFESRMQFLKDLLTTYSNTLFVASAGGWPANFNLPNVIAVGNSFAFREGMGADTVYAEGRVEVNGESAYGTSFAVPQAVIAAALAWQQNGYLNAADVKNIIVAPTLVATADSEAGLLNPQASLELARSYTPPTTFASDPFFGLGPSFGFIW